MMKRVNVEIYAKIENFKGISMLVYILFQLEAKAGV
jgi:hypothetical protein